MLVGRLQTPMGGVLSWGVEESRQLAAARREPRLFVKRGASWSGEACLRGIWAKAAARGSRDGLAVLCSSEEGAWNRGAGAHLRGPWARRFRRAGGPRRRGLRRATAPDVRLDAPRCLASYAGIERLRAKAGAARVMRAGGASGPKLWACVNTPVSTFSQETRPGRETVFARIQGKNAEIDAPTSGHRRRSQRAAQALKLGPKEGILVAMSAPP